MGIILDLIALAIVVVCVLLASKRGFVRTAINFVGLFAAFIIAFTINTPLANVTYTTAVEPSIIKSVESSVSGGTENTVENVWEALPGFIKNDSSAAVKDQISEQIDNNISEGAVKTAQSVSENVVMPIFTKLLATLYGAIIFIVLLFVVRILANVLNKLFSFSIVGKLNKALGGTIGLFQGALFAILFILIVKLLVSFTGGFLIFTPEALESSFIYGFFANA